MDDLSGLDWSASSKPTASKAPSTGTGNYYTALRPNAPAVASGRSTPLSAQASGNFKLPTAAPKTSTPDSFSNLVSFGSSKQTTLTLQEQQDRLQAEKAKKETEKRRQYELQFGQSQLWDGLGSKSSTPSFTPPVTSRSSTPAAKVQVPNLNTFSGGSSGARLTAVEDNDDLFSAFNKDTKVDNSSHYPPPVQAKTRQNTSQYQNLDLSKSGSWRPLGEASGLFGDDDADDDPFGLSHMGAQKAAPVPESATADDTDDFLGDLGKPVDELIRKIKSSPTPHREPQIAHDTPQSDDPWDKAVAELMDMGFSAENSRRALTESGAGMDVQAAVGWLLNDAHRQAKEKASGKSTPDPRGGRAGASRNGAQGEESADASRRDAVPAWMRESRDHSQPRRDDSRSPANSDADLSKTAAAVGSNLLKTANSLWKTSQKKVQKAVSEFQQEGGDSSQPKWMRSAAPESQYPSEKQGISVSGKDRIRQEPFPSSAPSVTDEALMLEADSRPPPRRTKPATDPRFLTSSIPSSRDHSPVPSNPSTGRSTPVPRWQQSISAAPADPRSRLNKQAVEEQSAQAYVSPARRKKTTPVPKAVEEPDLMFSDSHVGPSQPAPQMPTRQGQNTNRPAPVRSPLPSKPSTPMPVRPKAPNRNVPSLSPSALANSTQHRIAGTAHFKRGDYASAHTSYSSSLSALPQGHPITIILLCNRSLTALKTGDPKASVADADTALSLIGPSRGEAETIDLQNNGGGEGKKDMKEFWGKALTRKAEALEQMERWKDAGLVWQQAVEAGVGGAIAVQGRQRCENALKPKPVVARAPIKKAPKPQPRPAMSHKTPASIQSTEAVNRLRAANAAAEKADDEKFALSDSVDARIANWREGRKDNLRALLGGLDAVLWEASGWKKVGMHELVMNGKVKIVYMKAIAKVHPDKLPQDAGTEVKMISASVFATLNEAWDKFKTDNGM